MSVAPAPSLRSRSVIVGAIGNMLEWYDFATYGYFSAVIGRNFFPSDSPATSLLSAFAVFAAAFFMRPIGGVVFVYLVTYLHTVASIPQHTAFLINALAMVTQAVCIPIAGALSDRI